MSESFTVAEFYAQHKISRSLFYKLCRQDLGPQIMKVGKRTLISSDAVKKWQKDMEVGTGSDSEQNGTHEGR